MQLPVDEPRRTSQSPVSGTLAPSCLPFFFPTLHPSPLFLRSIWWHTQSVFHVVLEWVPSLDPTTPPTEDASVQRQRCRNDGGGGDRSEWIWPRVIPHVPPRVLKRGGHGLTDPPGTHQKCQFFNGSPISVAFGNCTCPTELAVSTTGSVSLILVQ